MRVECIEAEEIKCTASSDQTLVVGPGHIIGDLTLSLYDNEQFGGPSGTTLVRFRFRDADGVGRQYSTALHPLAFWPESTDRATLAERPTQYDFVLMSSLDDRIAFTIAFDDGPPLCGVRKYQGFSARVKIDGSVLRVFARMNTDDPRAFRGHIDFVYDVPIRRLLWRKAPRSTGSDLLIENEPFVQIEEASAPKGIPPSPIWLR